MFWLNHLGSAYLLSKFNILSLVGSTLRQVCTLSVRDPFWSKHSPSLSLGKPASVGGCLLLILTTFSAPPASANSWQAARSSWSEEPSSQKVSLERSVPSPRSSFHGLPTPSAFGRALEKGSRPPMLQFGETATALAKLHKLIAHAEAGSRDYNAYHQSARVPPPALPTEMTLAQIFKWIEDTPGQHHAIGRYQFIPSTLADLQRRTGLGPSTRFNRSTQDALATILIYDAGFERFQSGTLTRYDFMANLAKIWAGFPLSNGRSAYHGYAGNKATITRKAYETYMAQIFPVEPHKSD